MLTRLLVLFRTRTFRSLRHRNYRLYFVGQLVSFTGSWMQSAALMWLVFDRTHAPLWPPLLLVAQVGPTLVLGPLGGALADRFPKRRLIILTQFAFLIAAVVLTLLVAFDRADPWLLFAVMFGSGIVQAIDLPARLAFVPDLVPRDDLVNAVSLNSLLFNSARAIGPAMAGLFFLLAELVVTRGWLVGSRPVVVGAIWCFGLNAVSFLAVLIALNRISVPGERTALTVPTGGVLAGLRYVAARPSLFALLLLTGGLCVFGWPTISLFPAYTSLALGRAEQEYSLLVSGLGAGALCGALTTATVGGVRLRPILLSGGAGLVAVGLLGLSVARSLPMAVGCGAILGFGLILFLSTGQSAVQLSVTDEVRGRVMALWAMTLAASAPVGHLLAGLAATHYPVRQVVATLAVGAAIVATGVVWLALLVRTSQRKTASERPPLPRGGL